MMAIGNKQKFVSTLIVPAEELLRKKGNSMDKFAGHYFSQRDSKRIPVDYQ